MNKRANENFPQFFYTLSNTKDKDHCLIEQSNHPKIISNGSPAFILLQGLLFILLYSYASSLTPRRSDIDSPFNNTRFRHESRIPGSRYRPRQARRSPSRPGTVNHTLSTAIERGTRQRIPRCRSTHRSELIKAATAG